MKSKSKPKQSKKEIEAALFSADLDWDSAKNGQSAIDIFVPVTLATTPLPAQLETEDKPNTEPGQSSVSHISTPQKIGHKADTNRIQTVHKADTELNTNRAQTEHRSKPHLASLSETGHKPDTQPDTIIDTNRAQTEHKPNTEQGFSSLVGLQREITVFVYESCKNSRSRITEPLSLEHVALSLSIRIGSVKTTLRRLEEKFILRRDGFKIGRGGWSRYELPDAIYRELLQLETEHKLSTNRTQIGYKLNTQPNTEPDTRPSSSSSSIDLNQNLKTTTTSEPELFADSQIQLSPVWSAVDTSPLADIGFTQTHLMQLARHGKLSVAEVESSIDFFAFDLNRNGKAKTLNGPPLNFFMGILRKGGPYAPPENYETPADESRRRTREFMERKERERQANEQRFKDLEFAEWKRGVAASDLARLLPEWAQKPGQIQDSAIRAHFDDNVWPEREAARLNMPEAERAEIRAAVAQSLGKMRG
ncbi:hypothetical protein WDW86_11290 [Bdellovibrionota bacterium FG-2]